MLLFSRILVYRGRGINKNDDLSEIEIGKNGLTGEDDQILFAAIDFTRTYYSDKARKNIDWNLICTALNYTPPTLKQAWTSRRLQSGHAMLDPDRAKTINELIVFGIQRGKIPLFNPKSDDLFDISPFITYLLDKSYAAIPSKSTKSQKLDFR